jgi:hypothetical protein
MRHASLRHLEKFALVRQVGTSSPLSQLVAHFWDRPTTAFPGERPAYDFWDTRVHARGRRARSGLMSAFDPKQTLGASGDATFCRRWAGVKCPPLEDAP